MRSLPLTGSDLRAIADVTELADDEAMKPLFTNPLIGRVEVFRPDSDDELIGHLVPCDDWFGFEFLAVPSDSD